ncbi:uncharacterized protein LOC106706689 [Latimeria chalumnae]|uniref:uncharacterized protein LOC106706689 n=1 Tax=Latimeria chalumnae TaxID=7897 RepID=UPI0006D8ED43|nr:PREDICTED: uncharacterized protein LOC106706689 [Latimeria chalumnae]|eukprot:XP_014353456.1 PREDICTED: uncharacterized protein LOC106706689 [Latimeria chalumnae]
MEGNLAWDKEPPTEYDPQPKLDLTVQELLDKCPDLDLTPFKSVRTLVEPGKFGSFLPTLYQYTERELVEKQKELVRQWHQKGTTRNSEGYHHKLIAVLTCLLEHSAAMQHISQKQVAELLSHKQNLEGLLKKRDDQLAEKVILVSNLEDRLANQEGQLSKKDIMILELEKQGAKKDGIISKFEKQSEVLEEKIKKPEELSSREERCRTSGLKEECESEHLEYAQREGGSSKDIFSSGAQKSTGTQNDRSFSLPIEIRPTVRSRYNKKDGERGRSTPWSWSWNCNNSSPRYGRRATNSAKGTQQQHPPAARQWQSRRVRAEIPPRWRSWSGLQEYQQETWHNSCPSSQQEEAADGQDQAAADTAEALTMPTSKDSNRGRNDQMNLSQLIQYASTLERFDPKTDCNIEDHITVVHMMARELRLENEHKILLLKMTCGTKARSWLESLSPDLDFKQLCEKLRDRFTKIGDPSIYGLRLKQKQKQNAKDYFYELEHICLLSSLNGIRRDECDLKSLFLNGLYSELRMATIPFQGIYSLHELVNVAQEAWWTHCFDQCK